MVALARAAGPRARHIVLSRSMASDLVAVMPEINEPLIIGNACLVDRELLELPLRANQCDLVLGHLSNLTADKGIAEVVSLASALREANVDVRLIIGGPISDDEARSQLSRATRELGDFFEYRGSLTGEAKLDFFNEITHFVFPTRYVHEAVPLVLYEAMAAGAVCVTTTQGSISEQLEGSPAVLASYATSFVEETLPVLLDESVSAAASQASREAFLAALANAEQQLADFVVLLGCG
jgi:glycosyltransferase involved in cell wall biosynthesis